MPPKRILMIAMGVRILLWACLLFAFFLGPRTIEDNLFPCFWVERLGMQCATCGATRAVVWALHGNFPAAFAVNPVVTAAILPILAFLLITDLVVVFIRTLAKRQVLSPFEYIFVAFAGPLAPLTPPARGGKKQ